MDLTHQQTRRLFLAGKVAFPTPFPATGTLSFELGMLSYAKGAPRRRTKFVTVQQPSRGDKSVLCTILQRRVAAVFIPGRWSGAKFRISRKKCVVDWENGEWFLGKDVSAQKVARRLRLSKADDITSRDSMLRGIVFVGEDQSVVKITEVITKARHAVQARSPFCTCTGECELAVAVESPECTCTGECECCPDCCCSDWCCEQFCTCCPECCPDCCCDRCE